MGEPAGVDFRLTVRRVETDPFGVNYAEDRRNDTPISMTPAFCSSAGGIPQAGASVSWARVPN